MKKSFGFAVQTKWKIKELNNKFNISSQKIVYWPNGTDVDKFVISETSNEVRKLLALPLNKKIILYTGQLFDWKGTDTLIKAVKYLSEESVIYLVGGTTTDIVNCKRNIIEANDSKIIFVPFVVHSQVPRWLKSADVLVLPNTGRQKVSLYYTSPMKLFEYMASGRPIVASSIPSILEILNNQNAFLIQPDDPVKLASMIKKVFSEQQLAEKIAHQAQNDVQKYTWQSRAQRIIDYFSLHA